MSSEPVLVLIKSPTCGHCRRLEENWPGIREAIKAKYPNLRHFSITVKGNMGDIDLNIYPRGISRYTRWYPMLVLIAGPVWDQAMRSLGPRNTVDFKDSAVVFNGVWQGETLNYDNKYRLDKDGLVQWLDVAVPQVKSPENPRSPLITNVTPVPRPAPTSTQSTPTFENPRDRLTNVCGMKIVPRYK